MYKDIFAGPKCKSNRENVVNGIGKGAKGIGKGSKGIGKGSKGVNICQKETRLQKKAEKKK